MLRQRVRTHSSRLGRAAGLILAGIVALALLFYGLMMLLAALGADPGFINTISGYRTAFNFLAGLGVDDLDGVTRPILAGAGLLAFLVFGFLAYKALPSPYLARQDLDLSDEEHGAVVVEARALERLAESSTASHPAVASTAARATAGRLELDVDLLRAESLGPDLEEIRERVRSALADHELPMRPVDVTMVGFQANQRRELK